MKVAYLINQYPAISHTFVRREIAALERQGVTVDRFAIRNPAADVIADEDLLEKEKTKAILETPKISLFGDMASTLFRRPLRSIKAIADSLRLGRRSEAGLLRHVFYAGEALVVAEWMHSRGLRHVHAHFGTNSATVAMLAADIVGGSFSVTVHGPEEFDKPALIHLPEKIERSGFIAAISAYGVSQLRRLVDPDHWSKIKIVRCGVAAEYFCEKPSQSLATPTFVSVGRLSEQKGQMTLVEAAAKLKAAGKNFSIKVIGDGELRPLLEAAIAEHGLEQTIDLAGWGSPDDVKAALLASRAFVLPSYAEGLPVSIMEAFAMKTPVITTYVAGIPELVRPGENGWLTPASDADALAAAMSEALAAPVEQLRAFGEHGAASVKARHDIDAEAAQLTAAFLETMERA